MENLINTTISGQKNLADAIISTSEALLQIFTTLDLRIQGDSYVGDWEYGEFHGYGTYTWANGDRYEGYWENGKKHGQGTLEIKDGPKYVGEFKDGKEHGEGILSRKDGTECYVGQFKDGKFHGKGIRQYANGDRYEGDWKDGKFHGRGKYTSADRSSYEGEWKNGEKHGKGTYTFANGNYFKGEWKDGKIIVESKKTKEKNKTLTLLLRSTEISSDNRPLKYETDKFLKGGKEVEVVVCEGKDQVLAKINEFIKKKSGKGKDKCRIVLDQHGDKNGGNDMGIDEDCAKEILKSLAGKFKDIIISDLACYGTTAKHFFEFAQSVASNQVNIKLRFAPQDRACLGVLKGSDGNPRYSIVTICEDSRAEKRESIEFLKKGQVILIYQDGTKYEGEWENGQFHGQGTLTDQDGAEYYKGEWKDGKFHGQGTLKDQNGKYVGEFKDDKKDGEGTMEYANGYRYEGQFKDGKFHGEGTNTFTDGSSYEGQFKDGRFHGQGIITYKDGTRYEGEFKDGNIAVEPKNQLKPSQVEILKIGTLAKS